MGTLKFGCKCQYIEPDLGTLSWLPICSILGWSYSFRGRRRMSEPGLSYKLNYHSQSKPKYAFEQKQSVTGKTITDKKYCPHGFLGIYNTHTYIYILKNIINHIPIYHRCIQTTGQKSWRQCLTAVFHEALENTASELMSSINGRSFNGGWCKSPDLKNGENGGFIEILIIQPIHFQWKWWA